MSLRRGGRLALVVALALVGAVPLSVAASVAPPWDPFFAAPVQVADVSAIAPIGATANRAYGLAMGDYDEDGDADLIVGRVDGRVYRLSGNGDGTFAVPVAFAWKQTTFNAWAFAPADVNGDGNLDIAWGSNALTTGCSVSPIPTGQTCASIGAQTVTVNDGDVRVFLGNGDGTFQENTYFVSGVRHNAGALVADIGTDASTIVAGDVDGDGDADLIAGAIDGPNATVKLLRNSGGGAFAAPTSVISQAAGGAAASSPIYWAPTAAAATTSPWGLALADVDADGDRDLWVGDRGLYVYLYRNDSTGSLILQTPNSGLPAGRENAYLDHDSFRAAVGFTPALASGDVNGDGRADLALGLQSGTQTGPTATPSDGMIVLDVSAGSAHSTVGASPDFGTAARSVALGDVNGDGYLDLVSGTAEGRIHLLRQLPPLDSDSDGVSDYVDNAPNDPNSPRIDMNTDGSTNHQDQLDNDFDTVLGDPENQATWQRRGDPADTDDDNDTVVDVADNCPFTANGGQGDADGDGAGNACDPLDDRDADGDGVPTGPLPADPLYAESLAAKQLWAHGDTHFVIRVDALGRLFQNEFTQLMTDAATLTPDEWQVKCWENYGPTGTAIGVPDPADPCGPTEGGEVTLEGGKEVPVTLVTIPRLLWTDEPVIHWINDRNDSARFELGQHGTYHFSNTTLGDWAADPNKNFFSCEFCGFTEAEMYELLRIGYDTLTGVYENAWVAQSGATGAFPEVDWSDSARPLISYAPPFNADDATGRHAIAQLGFRAYSSSVFEEGEIGTIGQFFTPEGSHHEQFDQFGIFHASADLEFEPPETSGGTYDAQQYHDYLVANTQPGELNTWLIEEVEWSGRPCNDLDRLGDLCSGASNRENNTVYGPRWDGWMQLLDYVKSYPGGVAVTMGDVALAMAFDNAPTVLNADQADSDMDGMGDVIEGVTLDVSADSVSRNQPSALSATLAGDEGPLAGQSVTFEFDADGDGTAEQYVATSDDEGVAEVTVTPTRAVGPATVEATWDGLRTTAAGTTSVAVLDASSLTLDAGSPTQGQVTDLVTVGATILDSDGQPLAGRTVTFSVGTASASGSTDGSGHAQATMTLAGPVGATTLAASFAGDAQYGSSAASAPFTIAKEDTQLMLADAVAPKGGDAIASATLKEADGAPLSGRTVEFLVESKVRGKTTWVSLGTAVTNASGVATFAVPPQYVSKQPRPIRATFAGDALFLGSTDDAVAYR